MVRLPRPWTHPSIETLIVDNGYAGPCAVILRDEHQLTVEVARHPANRQGGCWRHLGQGEMFPVIADSNGFVVLPERRVVERTHGWNERSRRLVMHHDRRTDVSEAWVWLTGWLTGARMLALRLAAAV